MAGGAKGGDEDGIITDINVTPLVDVVLVLLIILMVTATALVAKSLPMELPKAATGESVPTTMAVSLDRKGELFLNQDPVTEAELRKRVSAAVAKNPKLQIVIAANSHIEYREVVHLMDVLRQQKVTKFALKIHPEDLAK